MGTLNRVTENHPKNFESGKQKKIGEEVHTNNNMFLGSNFLATQSFGHNHNHLDLYNPIEP